MSHPMTALHWPEARRIIRTVHPPIHLFEDLADPEDWDDIIAGESKTNPRLAESVGMLDRVPVQRRVGGPGASYLMAPFVHLSTDRPSRFSDGRFGVLYAGDRFAVALFETVHHHARFMAQSREAPGWTSQFQELVLGLRLDAADYRGADRQTADILHPTDYRAAQRLGHALRAADVDGLAYPSVRCIDGDCAAAFHPDCARFVRHGQVLEYHWDGERVDLFRSVTDGSVTRILG